MGHINHVVLSGNLTRDVELRTTPNGAAVASFGLAVNRKYKNNTSGEWVDEVSFFNIVVWGRQGETCAQYLKKGSGAAIEGRLQSRSWEAQDGQKRTVVEVIATNVQFTGGRNDSNERVDSPKDNDSEFTPIGSGTAEPEFKSIGGSESADVPF